MHWPKGSLFSEFAEETFNESHQAAFKEAMVERLEPLTHYVDRFDLADVLELCVSNASLHVFSHGGRVSHMHHSHYGVSVQVRKFEVIVPHSECKNLAERARATLGNSAAFATQLRAKDAFLDWDGDLDLHAWYPDITCSLSLDEFRIEKCTKLMDEIRLLGQAMLACAVHPACRCWSILHRLLLWQIRGLTAVCTCMRRDHKCAIRDVHIILHCDLPFQAQSAKIRRSAHGECR